MNVALVLGDFEMVRHCLDVGSGGGFEVKGAVAFSRLPSCPVVPFFPLFWEGFPFNVNQPKKDELSFP